MALLEALFSVDDVEAFLVFHHANEGLRLRYGCSASKVYRHARDPSMVLVLLEFPSAEAAEEYVTAALDQGAVERSTLAGIPRIEIFEEVTRG